MIHVMAALITDAKGRILMARRLVGRDFAGYWEFPGGKVDPGETPEAALARELKEELGIDARIDEAVMVVPQHAPKALKLDVRWVRHWTGTPKGLDGQALAWVPRDKLTQYAVPPPDVPVIAHLLEPDQVWITPQLTVTGTVNSELTGTGSVNWLGRLEAVLSSGVKRTQLRPWGNHVPADDALRASRALVTQGVELCRKYGAEVAINADVDLARTLGCGLHLKSSQLHMRALPDLPLSASCHNAEELQRAHALGCRYALLGPVAQTRSHPDASPLGWDKFFDIRGYAPALPTYALGGMTPADIQIARYHGAQGIATIRGL